MCFVNNWKTTSIRYMASIGAAVPLNVLLLLVATLASSVSVGAQRNRPGATSFHRTLLTSRNALTDGACNATSSNWTGGDKFQQPLLVSSPGECCKICQETPDCIIWLWRGCCDNCWIKNSIPEQEHCDDGDCVSGVIRNGESIKPDQEPPEIPQDDIETEESCKRSGQVAAIGAAFLGCKEIIEKCKKPTGDNIRKHKDLRGDLEVPESLPDTKGKAIGKGKGQQKQCAQDACLDHVSASDWAAVRDPECMALLLDGPRSGVEGCKNRREARALFEDIATPKCAKL